MPCMNDGGRGLIVKDDGYGEDYGDDSHTAAMTRYGAMGIMMAAVLRPFGRCREILRRDQ
jgi:hypothetical protein